MSDAEDTGAPGQGEDSGTDEEGLEIRKLLRGALAHRPPAPSVLGAVQRKIRHRSRGRFYRDRWSTDPYSPFTTFLVTALLMLALLIASFFLLRPLTQTQSGIRVVPAASR
ncbi:MAG TPA: hypothetical protein VGJ84_23920 [Polyangiaceae bacterium]|jgi:hypothetical protein